MNVPTTSSESTRRGLGRCLARRSIESLQADARTSGLPRTLSALNLVLLGIGCIVGAGIYVLPGLAAAHFAGPAVMLSFLLAGAACVLRPGGVLYTYGPYMRDGRHTAPSNAAFDASLKARDSSWGVRDIADIEREALLQGLTLQEIVEMPANNLSLVFVRN